MDGDLALLVFGGVLIVAMVLGRQAEGTLTPRGMRIGTDEEHGRPRKGRRRTKNPGSGSHPPLQRALSRAGEASPSGPSCSQPRGATRGPAGRSQRPGEGYQDGDEEVEVP
jgi:hypothetical protein